MVVPLVKLALLCHYTCDFFRPFYVVYSSLRPFRAGRHAMQLDLMRTLCYKPGLIEPADLTGIVSVMHPR